MQEQEIDLRDYINVIIKRKWIVLAVFFIAVIITAVISFIIPKVYEISMIIEPGVLNITKEGKPVYVDSAKNIEAKIKEKAFNAKIVNALRLDRKRTNINFNVSQPKKSNLLKVSIKKEEEKIELGLKILDRLFVELSNSYEEIGEYKKNAIKKEISIVSNSITKKENKIKLRERKLKILEEREKGLLAGLKEIKNNSEKLISQSDALLTDKGQDDDVSSLLYSKAVQQNIFFIESNNQLTELKVTKEDLATEIENLNIDINNLQIEIDELNLKKDNIRNIKFVRKPEVSLRPVKPNKKLNVAISGILSLMFGVFLAFFVEYCEKSK